jgi:hypothetical protein
MVYSRHYLSVHITVLRKVILRYSPGWAEENHEMYNKLLCEYPSQHFNRTNLVCKCLCLFKY